METHKLQAAYKTINPYCQYYAVDVIAPQFLGSHTPAVFNLRATFLWHQSFIYCIAAVPDSYYRIFFTQKPNAVMRVHSHSFRLHLSTLWTGDVSPNERTTHKSIYDQLFVKCYLIELHKNGSATNIWWCAAHSSGCPQLTKAFISFTLHIKSENNSRTCAFSHTINLL